MSLIKDRKNNIISSGSYERIFNNEKLGKLITKIHGTSIAAGTELEKIILQKANKYVLKNLEDFKDILNRNFINFNKQEIFVIPKFVLKKSYLQNDKEPDFLILTTKNDTLNIIELKDGWVFDTTKSPGEYKKLKEFQNDISKIISFKTKIYMCCFNSNDKVQIYKGCKKKILVEDIMTGLEFCKLINIDYDEIRNERKKDAKENLQFFVSQLLLIDDVKNEILNILNK